MCGVACGFCFTCTWYTFRNAGALYARCCLSKSHRERNIAQLIDEKGGAVCARKRCFLWSAKSHGQKSRSGEVARLEEFAHISGPRACNMACLRQLPAISANHGNLECFAQFITPCHTLRGYSPNVPGDPGSIAFTGGLVGDVRIRGTSQQKYWDEKNIY